ncbi:hypothetical protein ACF09J_26060 [Streptomyces sp. NPDC014889]|uniref:phthiocerol/phthiodiolone dimycocerosyl transferase family protein n=1 Tax=Streptomyces sp. NPDC014889 TaxID=3364928 RepID=UPI0036FD2EBC
MQRALAPSEAAMAATGSPTVVGWTLHGGLDTGLLRAAVRELARRTPVLSARIVEGPDGLVLRRDPADPPVDLSFASDGWAPHDAPFLRPGDQVLRAVLHRDGLREHTLTLLAWHAVSDAACVLALHRRLWRIHRELAAGIAEASPAESAGLPPSVEGRLLARHSPADVAAYAARWSARLDASQPAALVPRAAHDGRPGPADGAHRHRFTLSARQTEALAREARRRGASANSLLCAVATTAVRDLLSPEAAQDDHAQLTCLIPVDLRSRLHPPLTADEFAFAASTASATVTVGPGTELGTTAAEIGRQVETALDAGHAELEYLATAHMLHRLASAAVTVAVSNVTHSCDPPALPAGLTATRAHVLTIPPGPVPTLFVSRHDKALRLDLVQPRAWYTREQAGRLADALRRTLTPVTGAPGVEDLNRPAPPAG